jgi:thiol-disulfide isomerase/thioredoxin
MATIAWRESRWYRVGLAGLVVLLLAATGYSVWNLLTKVPVRWLDEPLAVELPAVLDPDAAGRNLTVGENGLVLHWIEPWCPHCKAGYPSFAEAAAEWRAAGIAVAVISGDGVGELVTKHQPRVDWFSITESPEGPLEVPGVPATWVIDREQRLVGRFLGRGDWPKKLARSVTERLGSEG